MALEARQVLNASGMAATIFAPPGGTVGLSLTGTWTGAVAFFGSFDGINFIPVALTPFPSGTAVSSATANGNFFTAALNYVAFKAVFTQTTGSVAVVMAVAQDTSWQDAFLAATSKYLSQSVSGGAANAQTVAAQANRAWRCRSVSIGFSVAPAAGVDFKITDGASSVLWEGYIPPFLSGSGTTIGGEYNVPLPPPDAAVPGSGGVVGTPGNNMVLTLAAPGGSVVSTVNAELCAA